MKVKTTFYYNRSKGKDYDPIIRVTYPKSRADQLQYQSTAKLVDQMVRTGQLVLASKSQYDFPDGKDDGRSVPVDRLRGLDYPEISQAMAENEKKLDAHKKNLSEMSVKGTGEAKSRKGSDTESAAANDGATVGSDGKS